MRKILLLVTLLITGLFLVSCSNNKDFDTVKDENLLLFYQGDTESSVTRDLTLLLKSLVVENATITWVSDKPEVIKVFGSKGEVTRGSIDEEVKLTATIQIGNKKQSVEFTVVVKATPPVTEYTVTFSVDGGSPINNLVVTEGSLINKPADPTKAEHVFIGWYKDSEFTNAWIFSSDKVNANTTLYAKWAQEGTQVESKLYEFNFSGSNVGNSYSSNLGATKQLPNLVGQELNVVLNRVAVNNNHATYTDDFLIFSASNKDTADDFSYIEFNFGKTISKLEFDAAFWSGFDAEQTTTFSLQVKSGEDWVSVYDVKGALASSTSYKKITISSLTGSHYRLYATGVDPTGAGANGARILLDNLNVYGFVEAGEDLVAPVISGAVDLTFEIDAVIDLLAGVSASDDVDGTVAVTIKSSDVDNTKAGNYTVVYEAADKAGNKSTVTIKVTITEKPVMGESLVGNFNFTGTDFGNSYSSNQGVTKNLPNLVGGSISVVLHRAAANNNHTTYKDDFLVLSASNKEITEDFSYAAFNFGKVISRMEFEALYWSSFDAEQTSTLSLQVKNGDNWTDVFDIKAALNGALELAKVSIPNLNGSEYRIYATGIDPTGSGSNGARVVFDNIKVYEESDEDSEAPVISGAVDLTFEKDAVIDLLSGVSAKDNFDGTVAVTVKSSDVDNTKAGSYTVVYEAIDKAGNRSTVTITVTITSEPVMGESLVGNFNFSGTDFGNSYSSNQGATKNLPNLVGGSISVVLHRAAQNNNHTTYKDDFLVLSASNKDITEDFSYAAFNFGKVISRMEFDAFYWSSFDAEQTSTLSLQEKSGDNWVDVYDIKAALNDALEPVKLSVPNLTNSEYRIYATGIDPTGTGSNGARVVFDNIKVYEASDKDTIAPVISGAVDLTVELGSTVNLLEGVTALDNVDGQVTVRIYESDVNPDVEGEYTVVYEAIDNAGNRTTVTITVTVFEPYEADGQLAFSFDFESSDFGNSYSVNQNVTKPITNLVTSSTFNITLTRVAYNSKAEFPGKYMLLSSASGSADLTEAFAIFDFGQEISSMVFDSAYWSETDATQNSKFVLQVDNSGSWVDVFDIKAALNGALVYEEIIIDNLSGTKFRFFSEGTRSQYNNGGRILVDDIKVYTGGGATPEEKNLDKDANKLDIVDTIMFAGKISLPVLGEHGSTISWVLKTPSSLINLETLDVTMPASGQTTVTLVATLTNGDFSTTIEFDVILGESESISITDVYLLSESSQFKTTGTVSNIYEDANGKKLLIQDSDMGIVVCVPSSQVVNINDKVEIIGSKSYHNGQDVIDTVLKFTVVGTEEVVTVNVASPLLYQDYLGKRVSTSGVLVKDYNNEDVVVLLNKFSSFDVIIPTGLISSLRNDIVTKLDNKEVGLLVNVTGNVIIDEENYSIVVTKASDITVDTMINTTLIQEIVDAELVLPVGGNVTKDISLPTSIGIFDAITITWVSNKPSVISNTGKVTTGNEDQNVTLTYTVKLGTNEIDSGTINFIVTASGTYDGYYSSLTGLSGTALKNELSRIVSNMKSLSYGDARYILGDSDADPAKPGNVILVYNRASVKGVWDGGTTWNREHVWPQSKLGTASDSDLHNLKPANQSINSSRGNLPFLAGSGTFGHVSGGWFPGEYDKGDIARIVLYMNVRWGLGVTSTIGNLQTFIKWHNEDPVDAFEMNRNNVIYNKQNNRNPFIDHPELVTEVYGSVVSNYESYKPSAQMMLEYTLDNVDLYQVDLIITKKEYLFA